MYTFGIIGWKRSERKGMNSKARKLLTMHGLHHPNAAVERLHIKRWNGGTVDVDSPNLPNYKVKRLVKAHNTGTGTRHQVPSAKYFEVAG